MRRHATARTATRKERPRAERPNQRGPLDRQSPDCDTKCILSPVAQETSLTRRAVRKDSSAKTYPTAEDCDRLAVDLGLTRRERLFCELHAANPGMDPVDLARQVGYSGDDKVQRANIGRVMARQRVRRYLSFIRATAHDVATANGPQAIADLAECLQFLTTVKRANLVEYIGNDGELDVGKIRNAPAGYVKRLRVQSTTNADGQVMARHEVETESALRAVQLLMQHHEGNGRTDAGQTVNVAVALKLVTDGALAQVQIPIAQRVTED